MVQYLRATAYPRTRSFSLFFRMLKISAYDRKELKRSSILEFFSFSVQRPADKSLNRRERVMRLPARQASTMIRNIVSLSLFLSFSFYDQT